MMMQTSEFRHSFFRDCFFRGRLGRASFIVSLAAWISFVPVAVGADLSMEEAEKELSASFVKIQSGTAKTTTTQDFTLSTGQRIQSESVAKVAWMRKGDAILYRSDVTATQSQAGGGEIDMKSEGNWSSVHDGEYFYVVSSQHGQTHAAKHRPDPAQFGEPKAVLANLRQNFKIERMPDAKSDGFDCFVFELTPLLPEQSPTAHTTSYFRKDVGLNIKNVGFDKDGRQAFVSTTTDIEVNVPVSAERFVFVPPAGIEVQDKSKD